MSTPPLEDLRAAEKVLREKVTAAREDLRSSVYFDHNEANFTGGIDNACGGAAGELAASFTPALAEHIADWLAHEAKDLAAATHVASKWPDGEVIDPIKFCEDPDSVRHALAAARSILGGNDVS